MGLPYNIFTDAFLNKITEFDIMSLKDHEKIKIVDGYMKKAIANFRSICLYNLSTTGDDFIREFDIDVKPEDIDELSEIISEGMVVQWLRPYVNRQELLENALNTKDFITYSSAELLLRVRNAYKDSMKNFINMMREYSFIHGDLTDLHL